MDRWIFLSGMMGSGKSTVGRLLAERLAVGFVDLDAAIVERAGRSIAEIFATDGEDAFRAIEASEARRVLERAPCVIALGGGTVLRRETRRSLLRHGTLVTLRASPAELARRLEGAGDRPLLARGEAARMLESLLEARAEAYAECHAVLETEGKSPEAIADAVAEVARVSSIVVPLGPRTYRVEVGEGLLAEMPERVASMGKSDVVVVSDSNVHGPWAAPLAAALRSRAIEVVLEPGEVNKTLAAVERIWDAALARGPHGGVDRDALVLAVGGGVVGDLAAFAASTLLRGVGLVQAPTSLLAMVDASVGGKTGFDRPEGKNLIGTFHQPLWVVCDVASLSTLPDAEVRSGTAEVVKAAWIDSEASVRSIEADAEALLARDRGALERAVRMAVQLKADVVAADERESGGRMVLNLGHTLGHAIETARGYAGVRHGEAVALGMIAAFRVAHALGDSRAAAHEARLVALLRRLGLPSSLEGWIDAPALALVGADKKRARGKVRFVVPGEPGRVDIASLGVDELGRMLL